jgi:hypothetical protein
LLLLCFTSQVHDMMSELESAEAKLKTQLSKPIPGTPAAEDPSNNPQGDSATSAAKKLDANSRTKASAGKEVKRGKSVEKKSTKAASTAKK